jgi:4-amino-4-deoxychorismate lyase
MSRLFETIKVYQNKLLNLEYHTARVNSSRQQLWNARDIWDVSQLIELPDNLVADQVYKCRFVYSGEVETIGFFPYFIKPLQTLKLVECMDVNYPFKFTDRGSLENLKQAHPGADDIIITQNQRIMDCSYANMIFFDGCKWLTPASALLKGTKRQKYIEEMQITEEEITVRDLKNFKTARIINAMIDIGDCPDIPIENIH